MTVAQLVAQAEEQLLAAGSDQARFEAELLLAHAMGTSRLDVHVRWKDRAAQGMADTYRCLVTERQRGKPLQYLAGRASFRELDLAVDSRVLIPRPETEGLVDLVLARYRHGLVPDGFWVDVGTGSGAIALSLAFEEPALRVVGVELSHAALEVAEGNLVSVAPPGEVTLLCGSLLEAFATESVAVVVSNPPYISFRERHELPPEIKEYEPAMALDGGVSGLRVAHELAWQAARVLRPGGILVMELGDGQPRLLAHVLSKRRWPGAINVYRDLTGRDRYILATRQH